MTELKQKGTFNDPVILDGPIPENYPEEHKNKPYIYVKEIDGQITKIYRSYVDYCD